MSKLAVDLIDVMYDIDVNGYAYMYGELSVVGIGDMKIDKTKIQVFGAMPLAPSRSGYRRSSATVGSMYNMSVVEDGSRTSIDELADKLQRKLYEMLMGIRKMRVDVEIVGEIKIEQELEDKRTYNTLLVRFERTSLSVVKLRE
jgi:hypothetical protein